jgi:general secretion pathway protein A
LFGSVIIINFGSYTHKMDYYRILKLNKEPFSNSPDPSFFYQSRQHHECLQKLEIALRLRRGLNVIIGDVGTGKTTLCRQLIRKFGDSDEIETHLILDPYFNTTTEFLTTVAKIFTGTKPPGGTNDWQLKEIIKQYLFLQGVDQQKTVILIIDEGQKIPIFCLEVLREFLNYETNEYKLLQIVIFAQKEFEKTIQRYANLSDRINLYHYLKPLSFGDTRQMIRYRLEKSSDRYRTYTFFSFPALVAIFLSTGGYPRKIINLCHRCILTMILQNKSMVDLLLVRSCIQRVFPNRTSGLKKISTAAIFLFLAAAVVLWLAGTDYLKLPLSFQLKKSSSYYDSMNAAAPVEIKPAPLVVDSETSEAEENTAQNPEESLTPDTSPDAAVDTDDSPAEEVFRLAVDETDNNNRYEDILGRVTLQRNETLSGLIKEVYGNFNFKHFKSLILANPNIEDPDVVKIGQTILFPAIPVAVGPFPNNVWWVSVGDKDSLEDALQIIRVLPRSGPQIRVVPYWNQKNGTKFALLHKQYFFNKSKALKQLKRLQSSFASEARLLASWDEGTIFFADPFFGRRPKKSKRVIN